jgi:integrase
MHTGMRIGECLKLKWEDVDLAERKIHLLKTKNGRPRTVPINSTLLAVFQSVERVGDYVLYHKHTDDNYTTPKDDFSDLCDQAGIRGVTFHTFRHTFISRMIALGVDLATIRDIVGHASLAIISRYAHSTEQQRQEAVERLAAQPRRECSVNDTAPAPSANLVSLVR